MRADLEACQMISCWKPGTALLFGKGMYKRQTSDLRLNSSLLPSKALPEIFRKRDVISYEAELKNVLKQ